MRIRTGVEWQRGPSFFFYFTFWILLNLPLLPPMFPRPDRGQPSSSCPAPWLASL